MMKARRGKEGEEEKGTKSLESLCFFYKNQEIVGA
jgi:hypothetical protein